MVIRKKHLGILVLSDLLGIREGVGWCTTWMMDEILKKGFCRAVINPYQGLASLKHWKSILIFAANHVNRYDEWFIRMESIVNPL